MAIDKKISELTELTSAALNDLLAVVDYSEDETKYITVGNIGGSYRISTQVNTGSTVVDSFSEDEAYGCFWDYTVRKATNVRTGTIMAAWEPSGNTTDSNEYTTGDLGDTSGVTFAVDISGDDVRLTVTVTSDAWDIAVRRRIV